MFRKLLSVSTDMRGVGAVWWKYVEGQRQAAQCQFERPQQTYDPGMRHKRRLCLIVVSACD